jgi:hypothetical protein
MMLRLKPGIVQGPLHTLPMSSRPGDPVADGTAREPGLSLGYIGRHTFLDVFPGADPEQTIADQASRLTPPSQPLLAAQLYELVDKVVGPHQYGRNLASADRPPLHEKSVSGEDDPALLGGARQHRSRTSGSIPGGVVSERT